MSPQSLFVASKSVAEVIVGVTVAKRLRGAMRRTVVFSVPLTLSAVKSTWLQPLLVLIASCSVIYVTLPCGICEVS